MKGRHDHLDAVAMGLMVVLCATWGLQQVAIKIANTGVSPLLQAGIRSAGAALLLWAWAATRRIRLYGAEGSLKPGLWAGLLFAGEFCLIYWGLTYTTASRAVLLLYTAPFVVALGAHWFIPGEPLRLWQGPASRLAAFSFLTPLFGILAGGLLLDEPVTGWLLLALLLVAAGIWLVNRPAKR